LNNVSKITGLRLETEKLMKLVCSKCTKVYEGSKNGRCPGCGLGPPYVYEFRNSDKYLKREIPLLLKERKRVGLEGLVGGLECVVINTEPDRQKASVEELLRYTGLEFAEAFQDSHYRTCLLKTEGSADFLIRSRLNTVNPFLAFNNFPKSKHLPNTRLESFVFVTKDMEKYVSIQRSRGVRFLTDDIIRTDNFWFIQTEPSKFTGNSLGFIQWTGKRGNYASSESEVLDWQMEKPKRDYLKNIKELDHAATRVEAEDRDAAIIEFMGLTNYDFDFAIYVKLFNSITNVARLSDKDYAMVFTSGISPYVSDQASGPTEKFIHNYGPRVHHMAFRTEYIEDTFSAIKADGMDFLIELVGSPEEGLKQTFTVASEHTLLVNEYIHRYGDFDGFFTKSNVTLLTGATDKQ
jgi:4-hydroxyphenylpyruvate dioxygenase-like putative hemolysin